MLDTDPPRAIAQDAAPDEGVWIVIPAYNEARTIRGLAEAALALCVRVLVIDDGSSDDTAEQLNGLPLTLLRHPVNRGKAAGLRTAFQQFMRDRQPDSRRGSRDDGDLPVKVFHVYLF